MSATTTTIASSSPTLTLRYTSCRPRPGEIGDRADRPVDREALGMLLRQWACRKPRRGARNLLIRDDVTGELLPDPRRPRRPCLRGKDSAGPERWHEHM